MNRIAAGLVAVGIVVIAVTVVLATRSEAEPCSAGFRREGPRCMPLGDWARYAPALGDRMRAQLARIAAAPNLSKKVYELVSRALGAAKI